MLVHRLSRVVRSPAVFGFALLAGGACSPKDEGPKYPDINSFCNARASSECSAEVLASCGAPDAATCIARRQQVCVTGRPPNTTYSPSSAESCISAVSAAYADAKITLAEKNSVDGACTPVFDGPGAKNATCQKDNDCQVSIGLRCVASAGSTSGSCQVPQPVQGGGSCAASEAQCISGFHCGITAHCDINAALNEACANIPCAPDLICSTAGTCQAKSPDGSVCASDGECLHGICNKASTQPSGLCVLQVTLAPAEPFCVESR
jgi:hypothetical protein